MNDLINKNVNKDVYDEQKAKFGTDAEFGANKSSSKKHDKNVDRLTVDIVPAANTDLKSRFKPDSIIGNKDNNCTIHKMQWNNGLVVRIEQMDPDFGSNLYVSVFIGDTRLLQKTTGTQAYCYDLIEQTIKEYIANEENKDVQGI